MLPTIFMPIFDAASAEQTMSRPSSTPLPAPRRISIERSTVRRSSAEHEALPELRRSA